jgi:sugar-specific transcriptional regulator TrmB
VDASILEEIGLTNAQIKVYIALLELGETTSGPIIKKSELQNSVVYNALHQLIEQGLVSFISKGKRKYFSAANPKTLIKFIEEKKSKVEQILPDLLAKQTPPPEQNAQVFLGWKGVFAAFNYILETLPKGSEYIGFLDGFENLSESVKRFFHEFQKKMSMMNYKVKLIANESSREEIQKYKYYPKFGKPDYRFVPGFAPIGLIIFGNNVLNVAFSSEPVAIITTSKQIAHTNRVFFNNMWQIAKK